MDIATLPFNQHLGLFAVKCGDDSCIGLSPSPQHMNHMNTLHATVIYGVAEAASGACLLSRYPAIVDSHICVLRNAEVKYRRPGLAEGDVVGRGTVSTESWTTFLQRLEHRNRALVDVGVRVLQDESELFTGTFQWFVARNET